MAPELHKRSIRIVEELLLESGLGGYTFEAPSRRSKRLIAAV
jgi:hypothetical protein